MFVPLKFHCVYMVVHGKTVFTGLNDEKYSVRDFLIFEYTVFLCIRAGGRSR